MKISTAMALGRALIRPVAGIFNDGVGGGCAWGMVRAAAPSIWNNLQVRALVESRLPCGCTLEQVWRTASFNIVLADCIIHLFDVHVMEKQDWTMDQLIDWVAANEPPDPEEVTESVKEEVQCKPELVAHS